MKKTIIPFVVLACAIQSGCSSTSVWQSQQEVALRRSNAVGMANDIVAAVSQHYPPAKTVLSLSLDEGEFGQVLETTLRDWGYATDTSDKASDATTKMAYSIDALDDESTYWVGIRIAPDFRLDRLYKLDKNQYLAATTGFSVRGAPEQVAAHQTSPDSPQIKRLSQSWTVQVFASKDLDEVEHHQKRLRKIGYSAHVVDVGTSGKMKGLRLGPFPTAKQAKVVRKTMRGMLFKDAYLVAPAKSARS